MSDWHKSRHSDHWNRIEDLGVKSHSYKHLIFDKEARNKYALEKIQHLQQMVLVKLTVHMQKNANWCIFITLHKGEVQVDHGYPRNQTNWISYKREYEKTLAQDNISLIYIYVSGSKINNWQMVAHKTEKIMEGKVHCQRVKWQPIDFEKIFFDFISNRSLIYQICNKEIKKLDIKI